MQFWWTLPQLAILLHLNLSVFSGSSDRSISGTKYNSDTRQGQNLELLSDDTNTDWEQGHYSDDDNTDDNDDKTDDNQADDGDDNTDTDTTTAYPSEFPTAEPTPFPTESTISPTISPEPTLEPTTHVPTPTPKCLNCETYTPTATYYPTYAYIKDSTYGTTESSSSMETIRVMTIIFLLFTLACGMTYWGWLRGQKLKGSSKQLRLEEEEFQSDHSDIALNVMHDYSSDPKHPAIGSQNSAHSTSRFV